MEAPMMGVVYGSVYGSVSDLARDGGAMVGVIRHSLPETKGLEAYLGQGLTLTLTLTLIRGLGRTGPSPGCPLRGEGGIRTRIRNRIRTRIRNCT